MARAPRKKAVLPGLPTSLDFFAQLKWIDGRPLLDTIEPYRREMFTAVLDTHREDGTPQYNFALIGRGKKNNKTTDLVLTSLYKLLIPESFQGNQCYDLANDIEQANDDLELTKKLVQTNRALARELKIEQRRIIRKDGRGALEILPARDSAGAHGKTACFVGFDEIHAYKDYNILEALTLDPTRTDALTMICSYDTFFNRPGVPLFDFKALAKSGEDPRMFCQWYSADWCTDLKFADLPPGERANPSMASWPEGRAYLDQQRHRLPFFKFRRLHLNLPGVPDGSIFDPDLIMGSIVKGRRSLHPEDVGTNGKPRPRLHAFVDMSGGSADDAVLGIAYRDAETRKITLASIMSQTGKPPFSPRAAVSKFATDLKRWHLSSVTGDAYAGQTFRADFQSLGINYIVSDRTASALYEAFEVHLNAGEVELLDIQKLQDQFLGLVLKGSKIDHLTGEHDDWANAAAGAITLAADNRRQPMVISDEMLRRASEQTIYSPHMRAGIL